VTHPKQLLCGYGQFVGCVGCARDSIVCQGLLQLRDLVQALESTVHVAGIPQISQPCKQAGTSVYWYCSVGALYKH
jgi:hypothetical protein